MSDQPKPESPDHFAYKGYYVVRGLLDAEEAQHYRKLMQRYSHLDETQFATSKKLGGLLERFNRKHWKLSDGLNCIPDFWPLVYHEKLIESVKKVLGPDVKFLQHNDLHVGFSASTWHRDSVDRDFGDGKEWDEEKEPYRLVRVGIYFQTYAESGFELGVVPGSNKEESDAIKRDLEAQYEGGRVARMLRDRRYGRHGKATVAKAADWFRPEPGDCIIFDPRLLHYGTPTHGPKYNVYIGYGMHNRHYDRYRNYYRVTRAQLGYRPLSPGLISALKERGLYDLED